jgi:hypothetical protein
MRILIVSHVEVAREVVEVELSLAGSRPEGAGEALNPSGQEPALQ